jgi:hypothetical protein
MRIGRASALGREPHEHVDGIPDIYESRREWREPDPDQVRPAEVDDHVALDQRSAQLLGISVGHGYVGAAS